MSTIENDPDGPIIQIIDEQHAVDGCTLTLHLHDDGWIYTIVRDGHQLASGPRLFPTTYLAAELLGRKRLSEILFS